MRLSFRRFSLCLRQQCVSVHLMFLCQTEWYFRVSSVCVSNTGMEEPLPQQRAWMTDEELICNLVKRFFLNVFRLVGNFPSMEQKHCEVAGFLCCHSTEVDCNLIRWRSDLQCSTALCSCVKKTLYQQLRASSFPFLLNPGTNMSDSRCSLLKT